jgi:glycosyltransferase involved in cell wall biosynthesis
MPTLNVLFVHNNFPAQFRNLAGFLSRQQNVHVRAIASHGSGSWAAVDVQRYRFRPGESAAVHCFARRFDQECRRAEQVMYAANALKVEGFDPALIYVHPGWGEALPLRALFPRAVICVYAEFYYHPHGTDVGFDREFGQLGIDGETRVAGRNAASLLALVDADIAIAPTRWQRSGFPKEFQSKIQVIHDGIDTDALKPPAPEERQYDGEILTYVSRNLEPYRGFHSFMRALPEVLRARPKAQVHIVGGDRVTYGNPPRGHANWREAMLAEVGSEIDLSRVHFTGQLNYAAYLELMHRSTVHIYLTYPFVLSWSVLEAMALGCHVIGSDTPPVQELIEDGVNGQLVPFADRRALASQIIEALAEPARFDTHRRAARQAVVDRYDFKRVALPAHLALIERYFPGALRNPLPPKRISNPLEKILLESLKEFQGRSDDSQPAIAFASAAGAPSRGRTRH